jgi:hypothetical protein
VRTKAPSFTSAKESRATDVAMLDRENTEMRFPMVAKTDARDFNRTVDLVEAYLQRRWKFAAKARLAGGLKRQF